jgi:hypothetical protein
LHGASPLEEAGLAGAPSEAEERAESVI